MKLRYAYLLFFLAGVLSVTEKWLARAETQSYLDSIDHQTAVTSTSGWMNDDPTRYGDQLIDGNFGKHSLAMIQNRVDDDQWMTIDLEQ